MCVCDIRITVIIVRSSHNDSDANHEVIIHKTVQGKLREKNDVSEK